MIFKSIPGINTKNDFLSQFLELTQKMIFKSIPGINTKNDF